MEQLRSKNVHSNPLDINSLEKNSFRSPLTVCSSISSPINLVNNIFASVHYLVFNIKWFWRFKHFSKLKTEYQLKSKLAWSVFQKSMKLKQNGTGAVNTAKNNVFIFFLLAWIDFWWGGNKNLVGMGAMRKFLAGGGDFPHRSSRENPAVLKKCTFFSYSLLSKILKFRRSSLRLVFLIKIVYNQFLLLKNYRLWHWIRSFVWFIPTNLESIISG